MAADTKAVDEDDNSVFKSKKLVTLPNHSVVGCAGESDCRDVLTILGKASVMKLPAKTKLNGTETEFVGIWAFNTGQVFRITIALKENRWSSEILPILDDMAVAGSGGAFAMGAMAAGKSAIEGARIACRLDNTCGLPVEYIRLTEI